MQPGEPRLAIDYGAATAVAVLAGPDGRWMPLSFEGSAALPSAVHIGSDGQRSVGPAAWRHATADPEGLVDAPLRHGSDVVSVRGIDVAVQDLVAATLRYVGDEAVRVCGAPVPDVRLVVPAGWGPRRRTWMRQAAHRAGLGQPRLVEAPVAAADRLLATGVQLPVGSFLLVCDVGAGCEVSVLRRGATGFEVLSTLADADAGGARIDESLLAALPLSGPERSLPERDRRAVLVGVRTAKEALSQLPAVTVMMPPPAAAVVLTGPTLDDAALPVVKRAAELAAEAVAAAELTPDQLTGVSCIGGAAVMPAISTAMGERLGVAAHVLPEPGLAAVLGAAEAGGLGTAPQHVPPASPEPPLRRAIALTVPGVASLTLVAHFLLSADFNNGSRQYKNVGYYVLANWGELAVAALFALLTCLAAGSLFGAGLARAHDLEHRAAGGPAATPNGGQVGNGIAAAVAVGLAVAGLYGVLSALYLSVPMADPLPWALYPVAPVALIAAVVAVLALRRSRAPAQGWDAFLAFPLSSVVATAAGMVLVQYSVSAERLPAVALLIEAAGRVGGLLIGVGIACAVVNSLVLRLVVAVPLAVFCAAIVSWNATGVLAGMYTVAVVFWWARRLWDLVRTPARTAPRVA